MVRKADTTCIDCQHCKIKRLKDGRWEMWCEMRQWGISGNEREYLRGKGSFYAFIWVRKNKIKQLQKAKTCQYFDRM